MGDSREYRHKKLLDRILTLRADGLSFKKIAETVHKEGFPEGEQPYTGVTIRRKYDEAVRDRERGSPEREVFSSAHRFVERRDPDEPVPEMIRRPRIPVGMLMSTMELITDILATRAPDSQKIDEIRYAMQPYRRWLRSMDDAG